MKTSMLIRGILFRTLLVVLARSVTLVILPTVFIIPTAKQGILKGLELQSESLAASIAEVTGNALGSALGERNVQEAFHLAPKLKSSSANVGAVHLSSFLKDLEALGRRNELEGTAELLMQIEHEYEAVRKALGTQRSDRAELVIHRTERS